MSKLIGTNANQIPSNADLGTAAFMDKTEFLLSKGSEMSAINAIIPKTAVDVFVYDTSKDSDGGAWRKRTQHTSWYNEPLNTSTRGSRKEFPAVAVIVATTSSVTIYDGNDATLPMWMVFNQSATAYITTGRVLTGIYALNGIISISDTVDLNTIKFIEDIGYLYGSQGIYSSIAPISGRNTNTLYTVINTSAIILTGSVNDVAMTVLSNAPIDPATGLPAPTIAVATNSGVSVIKDDGSVVDIAAVNPPNAWGIDFTNINKLAIRISDTASEADFPHIIYCDIPNQDYSANYWYAFNPSTLPGFEDFTYGVSSVVNHLKVITPTSSYNQNATDVVDYNIGFNSGLSIIEDNQSIIPRNRLHTVITSAYNTGWIPGDIKGAWLSDITQETVISGELVTNGTFDTDTAWTKGSNWTISGGVATTTALNAQPASERYLSQSNVLVVGKTYTLSVTINASNISSGNSFLQVFTNTAITVYNVTSAASGTYNITFIATDTTLIFTTSSSGFSGSFSIDDVTVRLADADRSVNNKGLQVFGNITKTPVATGADLVAYSGFSTSNYLRQPYNSSINFGTAPFSISLWFKNVPGNGVNVLFNWRSPSGGATYWQVYVGAGSLQIDCSDGTTGGGVSIGNDYRDNRWHMLTWCFSALNKRDVFIDGKLVGTSTVALSGFNDSNAVLKVGGHFDTAYVYDGSLALLRISATVPTAEQIQKIYNDEKFLFQDNAQATLYGTSDAVTALAYDDKTNLLHVGTSSGRSIFQGLRRIDNTTTAVGTAISAYDSLVVEE
jgi:trimeric autotransporter adhesin